MRRKEREITEKAEIIAVLERCRVLRLALKDSPYPYIVPLSFGLEETDSHLFLYFHGSAEGKKAEILAHHPLVGFEADSDGALLVPDSDTACGYSMAYESVIGGGEAVRLTDTEEKTAGLRTILTHYRGAGKRHCRV